MITKYTMLQFRFRKTFAKMENKQYTQIRKKRPAALHLSSADRKKSASLIAKRQEWVNIHVITSKKGFNFIGNYQMTVYEIRKDFVSLFSV